jgi:hypothetical protein
MPDMEYANQILMLGRGLAKLATNHPAQPYVGLNSMVIPHAAKDLYERGYRYHPELATKDVEIDAPQTDTGAGTRRMMDAHTALMSWLKERDPALHARVTAAQNDPMQSALLLAEIHREHPEVISKGNELMAQMAAQT